MKFEWLIARRLKLASGDRQGSPSLTVAVVGMVLAIVVMLLSVAIVMGFKHEITNKIYHLDAHIRVTNAMVGLDENYATVSGSEVTAALHSADGIASRVSAMSLIAEQSTILKTADDFMGIVYRGVDAAYDWTYLQQHMIEGRCPIVSDTAQVGEVAISQGVARRLRLNAGDRVMAYFINDKVKARRLTIAGIYSTDFDSFDDMIMMGNIAQVQQVNGWDDDTGNYVAVDARDPGDIDALAYDVYSTLARASIDNESSTVYNVSQTHLNNQAFFSWLAMLDMNVVVILALMMIVAGFTLVSAMLMIVLDRVRTIGLLKALGTTGGSIRRIFLLMTQRLIVRALVIGNVVGIGLALAQKYLHLVRLDPATYYMPYVPIELSITAIVLLNVGILAVSYLALLGPSYAIARISPSATMRFE